MRRGMHATGEEEVEGRRRAKLPFPSAGGVRPKHPSTSPAPEQAGIRLE